ncbi:TPA: hypothetical protein EYP38_01370 [Candidatus Micrarchaeota archaeon]|nr:hypothetical protein [Candidatus Micrarchaeota archaeon]
MDILRYKVTSVERMTKEVKVLRMEPEGQALEYLPGHFAMLHALDKDGNEIVKRPYSIASSPNSEYLEFCIKMIGGEMTSILDKAREGSVIGVRGPMGHFTYNKEAECAFVAGGTGLAPFMSMLRYIKEEGIKGKFTLFYSARTRKLLLYREELKELAKDDCIEVVITLTREEPKDWEGETGRINEAMLIRSVGELAGKKWFLCGPLKMTISTRNTLLKEGVSQEDVKFEGWG